MMQHCTSSKHNADMHRHCYRGTPKSYVQALSHAVHHTGKLLAGAYLVRASAVTISSMRRERLLTVMRGTASLPHTTLTHQSRMAGSSDSLTRPPGGQNAQHFRSATKQGPYKVFT